MTQREKLASALLAAGLRLSPVEVETLMPAWLRYRILTDELIDSIDEPQSAP